MTETRTIEVKAYRCPSGQPTCSLDVNTNQVCEFCWSRHFGQVQYCVIRATDIERDDGGTGWLRPVDGCPVWGKQ